MTAKREPSWDDSACSPSKKRGSANPWKDEDLDILWGAIYEVAKNNVAQFAAMPHFKAKGRTNSALHLKLKAVFRDKTKNIK